MIAGRLGYRSSTGRSHEATVLCRSVIMQQPVGPKTRLISPGAEYVMVLVELQAVPVTYVRGHTHYGPTDSHRCRVPEAEPDSQYRAAAIIAACRSSLSILKGEPTTAMALSRRSTSAVTPASLAVAGSVGAWQPPLLKTY